MLGPNSRYGVCIQARCTENDPGAGGTSHLRRGCGDGGEGQVGEDTTSGALSWFVQQVCALVFLGAVCSCWLWRWWWVRIPRLRNVGG